MKKRNLAAAFTAAVLSAVLPFGAAAVSAEDYGFEITEATDETFADPNAAGAQTAQKREEIEWIVYRGDIISDLSAEDRVRFDNAVNGLYGEIYQPVSVIGVQLVSGVNYAYLCRTVPISNYDPDWKIVVVYEDLGGNSALTSIRDLNLNDLACLAAASQEGMTGAWTAAGTQGDVTAENDPAAESPSPVSMLNEETAGLFDTAMQTYPGDRLIPVTLLGTEGSGRNFLLLCRGETENLYVVMLHREPKGNAPASAEGETPGTEYENLEWVPEIAGTDVLDLKQYVTDGPRTFVTGNGVLSIQLPDISWRGVEDAMHLAAFTDGANSLELSHLVNGEEFAPVLIANSEYAGVYQVYYSTPEDVFIVTGKAVEEEAKDRIVSAIESVKVLRYGFEPVEPAPTAAPSDPRGERTGNEQVVFPDHSTEGLAIYEYANGLWYDDSDRMYTPGTGIENGYIWYDQSGAPRFLFSYPYELRRTGNLVEATWENGLTTTLQEYSDGIWRDFRYVSYYYEGDSVWAGSDGSTVYGAAPAQEEEGLDVGTVDDGMGGTGGAVPEETVPAEQSAEPVEDVPVEEIDAEVIE